MKQIAVLMACHNRKKKTLACLDALFQSKLPFGFSIDVFLVDDGSTDGTSDVVANAFPEVNIFQGDGNLYWSRGMHLAWKMAENNKDYDYYLWLNDDTYIFQQAMEVILTAAHITGNKAIIIAACCSKITGKLSYSAADKNGVSIIPENRLIQATYISGNCVLVPRYVFEKIGNIDPIFHHTSGDNDYGLRAYKKGIKSFLAPGFLAYCEPHDKLPKWCISSTSFRERVLSLYSPLGHSHPYYFFRYELRHFGLLVALKHLASIHLRLIMPSLWENK